ncbi:hypothetical protein VP01_5861g1 [Puccinia sorghi]|uniref:Uncharacterized protein n=1 Tax=Puccinia sorghi TaxID=27349 RepID=A0A0L6UIQ3_9BASI|nr:hypothetical protein VP01_5861g1 [Puccinia sorghi]
MDIIPVTNFDFDYSKIQMSNRVLLTEACDGRFYESDGTQEQVIPLPNPKRIKANGRIKRHVPIALYSDDTSGKTSKQLNKHISIHSNKQAPVSKGMIYDQKHHRWESPASKVSQTFNDHPTLQSSMPQATMKTILLVTDQPLNQYLNMIGVGRAPNGLAAIPADMRQMIYQMNESEHSALMATLSAIITVLPLTNQRIPLGIHTRDSSAVSLIPLLHGIAAAINPWLVNHQPKISWSLATSGVQLTRKSLQKCKGM